MSAVAHAMPLTRPQRWLSCVIVLVGCGGAAAVWALLALALNRQCGWMALVAAVDAVFLLRLTRVPAGAGRMAIAVASTAVSVVLANWWIAAAQIGGPLGLLPWDSIPKLGLHHAWTLVSLANGGLDLVFYALALCMAALAGR